MLSKVKNYLPKVLWNKDFKEYVVTSEAALIQQQDVINALNQALGNAHHNILVIRDEAIQMISAIAFQYGGEILVKQEFFDIVQNPDNAHFRITFEKKDDGLHIKLITDEETESEANKGESD